MPMQLLPASAAAFAPRAAPNIVLDTTVEPWLTQTLRRISKVKRSLNKPEQHKRCLAETLGGEKAIWTLTSLLLPKAPEVELSKDDDPLAEALANYDMVHVQAYVVHVDMVAGHEVAFKLTEETIEALVEYHRDIYTVDAAASLYSWPEKDGQVRKMHEDFVQAVNRFVFRTDEHVLEGLEEGGAGELLGGRSDAVKEAVMHLFAPLLPPPPRIVDVVIPARTMAQVQQQQQRRPRQPQMSLQHHYQQQQLLQQQEVQQHGAPSWWQQQHGYLPAHAVQHQHWEMPFVVATPSPTVAHATEPQNQWWPTVPAEPTTEAPNLLSPTPSGSQLDDSSRDSSTFSTPEPMPVMQSYPFSTDKASLCLFPSQLPCDPSMAIMDGLDTFGWECNDFAPQYAAAM